MIAGNKKSSLSVILSLAALVLVVAFLVIQGCGVEAYKVVSRDLASVTITPSNPTMAGGTALQLTAKANYSDASFANVTTTAAWTSSDPAVTVSTSGLATAATVTGTKTVTITASSGGKTGTITLTVKNLALTSLVISAPTGTINPGTTTHFTATGTFGTAPDTFTQDLTSMATWTTSDSSVATISAAGIATGLSAGPTTISASATVSGTTRTSPGVALHVFGPTLVSISIEPKDNYIPKTMMDHYTAVGTFSDSTTKDLTAQVTWSTANSAVASVNTYDAVNHWQNIMGVEVGDTTITATIGNKSDTTPVHIIVYSGGTS